MKYTKIINLIFKTNKGDLGIDADEQRSYIEKLGPAKNDYDRSYKQFLCQMQFYPLYMRIILNVVASFLLPMYVIVLRVKAFLKPNAFVVGHETIIDHNIKNELLPNKYLKKYSPYFGEWSKDGAITSKDLYFIWILFYKTFNPYFTYKCAVKISKYRYVIDSYQPKNITVFSEYSFTSSVMTAFCERNGIKHINVMHGEKFYYIRDSYFRFNECYIWMEYYKKLFISLYAEPTQFIIDLPPTLNCNPSEHVNRDAYADYKYYLAENTEPEMDKISKEMEKLKQKGFSIKYRPHPTYTDLAMLRKYVCEDEIEYPKKVDILESISNMKCAVGTYSTVLLQAFCAGKETLIDDVSNPQAYERLKKVGYIMLEHANGLLSQIA